ncbi:MAG: protein-L-isoaspartate O-methyltransferase [Bdellovibrionales bacterium]|nr:protein-L-isoaspartate O-methyltransferase [Oligoflexia bacterium]
MAASVREFQDHFIAQVRRSILNQPPSEKVIEAFYSVPRHFFVSRYFNHSSQCWEEISPQNLEKCLPELYADHPLVIFGNDADLQRESEGARISTISQPSFVLSMLDLLNVEEGMKVFELGTGSGWNAGLLAHLVGTKGKVVSVEIIAELASSAKARLEHFKFSQVKVLQADGAEGDVLNAPFDRAIFTAGADDFPKVFHSQIKIGGRVLFVLKNRFGSDLLMLLEKTENAFESHSVIPCKFVSLTGPHQSNDKTALELAQVLQSAQIENNAQEEIPFSSPGSGFRFFLSTLEPCFQTLHVQGQSCFGIIFKEKRSAVVAQDGKLVSYGARDAMELMVECFREWQKLDCPRLEQYQAKIYPIDFAMVKLPGQWIQKKKASQWLWSVKTNLN